MRSMDAGQAPLPYMPQIYAPPPLDDFSKWRLETREIIDQIEHRLKGETLVVKEVMIQGEKDVIEQWESNPEDKMMNEQGVRAIITAVETVVNRVAFLSNLTEEEIIDICRETHWDIVKDVYFNWESYQVVKNPLPAINESMTLAFLGFKRAQGAGERDAFNTIENVNRNIQEGGSQGRGWGIPFIGRRGDQ